VVGGPEPWGTPPYSSSFSSCWRHLAISTRANFEGGFARCAPLRDGISFLRPAGSQRTPDADHCADFPALPSADGYYGGAFARLHLRKLESGESTPAL